MADAAPMVPARRSRFPGVAGRIAFAVLACGMIGWGLLAIHYAVLAGWLRLSLAILFGGGAAWSLLLVRPRRRGRLLFLVLWAILVAWWLRIPASNSRDWQADVAVPAWGTVEGGRLTIRNLRHCDYRSETDYDVRLEDRAYDLDRLKTLDLFLVYWGSPSIAHTMLSFGFEGDRYLCVSIETRKEKGEEYSAIRGFFRQYELFYVFADERDLVRLRTSFRGEEVYCYRLKVGPEVARDVLLSYIGMANHLKEQPEWYNALTSNCTTNIRGHARAYIVSPWDWRILINGYLDEMAYENGRVDRSLPFSELKARCHVNERARAAGNDPAFSRLIRAGLPGMEESR